MLDQLRAARRSAGLSQRALAERVGIPSQSVKRLEKGVGSVANLLALMAALNFRVNAVGPGATLPDQLRGRRRRRGITLTRAAERAGLARSTVAGLERGDGSVASMIKLLQAIAPAARRRAPERSYWGSNDKEDRDSRFTPSEFMEGIYAAFGAVSLDPCAHRLSPVFADRRIMLDDGGDGLVDDWSGRLAFVNPPFSMLLPWLRRAHGQWLEGRVHQVVCLVPVRTDSAWFHEVLSADADIYLLRGRVRFLDRNGRKQPTPFSLMLVALGTTEQQRKRYAESTPEFWITKKRPTGSTVPRAPIRADDDPVGGCGRGVTK